MENRSPLLFLTISTKYLSRRKISIKKRMRFPPSAVPVFLIVVPTHNARTPQPLQDVAHRVQSPQPALGLAKFRGSERLQLRVATRIVGTQGHVCRKPLLRVGGAVLGQHRLE